jgi:hypothetical protein
LYVIYMNMVSSLEEPRETIEILTLSISSKWDR